MAPPRRLTEAEIDIWLAVARTILPRPGSTLPERPPEIALPAAPTSAPAPGRTATKSFLPSYSPPIAKRASTPPLSPLERRVKRRIAGGRIGIDGVLDLHGLSQGEAHDALHRFLAGAHSEGARLVLVVTGKGQGKGMRADGAEPGVLRRAVPIWLRDTGLRRIVLGFEEAALPHGGTGALYIRLRRREPGE